MNESELKNTIRLRYEGYEQLLQSLKIDSRARQRSQEDPYQIDYQDLVLWMKKEVNPFAFNKFTSHMPKPFGSLAIWCKKVVRKVLTPFLKICFKSQMNMNELTLTLAQIVCVLESRIQVLEKKLQEEGSK